MGDIPSSRLFKGIHEESLTLPMDQFEGQSAEIALASILQSGPSKDAKAILAITMDEISKGFCSDLRSAEYLNEKYGIGMWRPMSRFIVTQSCGKQRVIDDARRSGHNHATMMEETIFSISVDFIPATLKCLQQVCHDQGNELPEMELSTDDLPDAYRVRRSRNRSGLLAT